MRARTAARPIRTAAFSLGFAPVRKLTDPRAERLSELNIAGGVAYGDTVIGLPADAWLRPPPPQWRTWWRRLRGLPLPHPLPYLAGLIPTSEMGRMLILLELEQRMHRPRRESASFRT